MMIKSIKVIPTINIKPIARLLVFAMAFLCVITLDVKAEILTFNVCDTCEYTNLDDVQNVINNISNLSDKDIVININSDIDDNSYGDSYGVSIGDYSNMVNSVTINGNSYNFNKMNIYLFSKTIEINDCNNVIHLTGNNSEKINIKNSNIYQVDYLSIDSNGQIKSKEINLKDVLDIDEESQNNIIFFEFAGNGKIETMDLGSTTIGLLGGTINIYNSHLERIFNYSEYGSITTNITNCNIGHILNSTEQENIITNIYNSKFNSLKYANITSVEDPIMNEVTRFAESNNPNLVKLNYDIYDVNIDEDNLHTNTTVYFDKEVKLKPGNKLNLVSYLDYYTEDKEIEYTIEDESITKIENKELIALKEGNTKVTVTTDEGHVVYNINLSVEKETIPEKIDKMTIKVPITGSKIKAWVVVVSAMLLGIIGGCIYMLVKKKKEKI